MRTRLIPFHMAETFDDAELLCPEWTGTITETERGWLCCESDAEDESDDEDEDDYDGSVWLGREHL